MASPLKQNAGLVERLSVHLTNGGAALEFVPSLLRQILETAAWREWETKLGYVQNHDRFEDFVTTKPLKGLGSSMDIIRRIVSADPVTLDLLDQAVQVSPGRPWITTDNISSYKEQYGTSLTCALRRLRKSRPDLHSQVLSGKLSAHAAMVRAGYRKRSLTVQLDRPESIAKSLRKHMSPDRLSQLIELLVRGR